MVLSIQEENGKRVIIYCRRSSRRMLDRNVMNPSSRGREFNLFGAYNHSISTPHQLDIATRPSVWIESGLGHPLVAFIPLSASLDR